MASQRRSLSRTSLCDRPRRIRSSSFNRHVPRACVDIRQCRFFASWRPSIVAWQSAFTN